MNTIDVPPLAVPLADLDPDLLEVIEVDSTGCLSGPPRWKDDDSLREVPYRTSARDPGSLAGIWEALGRS